MKKIFMFALITIFSGIISCSSDDSAADGSTDYIEITMSSLTYTYKQGVSDKFTGANKIASGTYGSDFKTHIIASETFGTYADITSGIINGVSIIFSGQTSVSGTATVAFYLSSILYTDSSASITMTQYDAIGGRLIGTFTTSYGSGSFNVERLGDSTFD